MFYVNHFQIRPLMRTNVIFLLPALAKVGITLRKDMLQEIV